MFDAKTTCVVVVGAQWGDEGKGKLVDVLAERADLVVRYQGGANAGHTVVIGDSQFILRQIPVRHPAPQRDLRRRATASCSSRRPSSASSTSSPSAGSTPPAGCSSPTAPTSSCRTTSCSTPRARRARSIGTTGRGIGPAYEDKYGRRGIRVADLRQLDCTRALLADRVARANRLLELMGSTERASFEQHADLLDRLAPRLLPLAADTGLLVHRALRERQAGAARGRPGRAARRGPRHLSVRHLLQHHGGRRGGRRRASGPPPSTACSAW